MKIKFSLGDWDINMDRTEVHRRINSDLYFHLSFIQKADEKSDACCEAAYGMTGSWQSPHVAGAPMVSQQVRQVFYKPRVISHPARVNKVRVRYSSPPKCRASIANGRRRRRECCRRQSKRLFESVLRFHVRIG